MQDENNELPEGTDKVIVGASSTSDAAGTELNEETDVLVVAIDEGPARAGGTGLAAGIPSGASDFATGPSADAPTSSSAAGGSARGGAMINKLRSSGEKISGQAADKARGLVGQGLERGAEALANVGRMVGDTADGIDERLGAEYGDYARRAASAIEDAANSIAAKDADELIDDTRNFVRKSPGVALAGAAVVGFALARLIKAGLDRGTGTGDSEDGGSTGSREA